MINIVCTLSGEPTLSFITLSMLSGLGVVLGPDGSSWVGK